MTDYQKETKEVQAEDAILDDAEVNAGGDEAKPTYEQLLLTLQDAQAKADEHWNQLLFTKAEMENTRRRIEREADNARKYALEKFVNELLPVKDGLDLGFAAAGEPGADLAQVREGLALTMNMMGIALEKFGVKEINPQGEKFNPERHQAMSMQIVPNAAPNTVVAVYQKGYTLNDRLVRPAMVVVAGPGSGVQAGTEPPATSPFDEMA
ncbi:MAG: nucleotide exchange factor GrpE [Gammaproteobacteria bacterium]|nr:nucleotide exchange factor GrpE [Gammaproteobacteria bacterium]